MNVNTEIECSTRNLQHGQHKIKCPVCQSSRTKNKGDRPLSVNKDNNTVAYYCHHCGENGIVNNNVSTKLNIVKKQKKVDVPKLENEKAVQWLKDRKICPDVAKKSGCLATEKKI